MILPLFFFLRTMNLYILISFVLLGALVIIWNCIAFSVSSWVNIYVGWEENWTPGRVLSEIPGGYLHIITCGVYYAHHEAFLLLEAKGEERNFLRGAA